MRPRDRQIQLRGRALIELVSKRLPQEFEITGDTDAWPGVGVALLSRMAGTLEAVLDLQHAQRETDSGTLLRSLYEHVVHFAWLAAQPDAGRLKRWREYDDLMHLRAIIDARAYGIELSDDDPDKIKARLTELRGKELKTDQLAAEADEYWAALLPGVNDHPERTFRGLYATLYRHFSGGMAHPSRRGLNRVYDTLSPTRRRVHLEGKYQSNGPYGLATLIFAFALFAAGRSIGWPADEEIHATFERYPD